MYYPTVRVPLIAAMNTKAYFTCIIVAIGLAGRVAEALQAKAYVAVGLAVIVAGGQSRRMRTYPLN